MGAESLRGHIDEAWFGVWNPLRDEYGYPINTVMPGGLYVDRQGIIAKRWHPETGEWNEFYDLTRTPPSAFNEVIRRQPPELPFEALDYETKKAIRKSRSNGQIRPSIGALPSAIDPTGDARRRRERALIRARRISILTAVILSVGIIGGFIFLSMNHTSSGNKYDAQTACEDAIRAQLKAPSSAKFSNLRYVEKAPIYTIRLDVDSENSFGATIRSTYTCELSWTGSTYRMDDLTGP